MIEKMDMKSMDITEENVKKIQALFPNAVTEVIDGYTKDEKGQDKPIYKLKIDFDVLKQELSDSLIEDKQERYQMAWPDKSKSKLLASSRITSTLRPDKEKSVDFDNTQNLYIEGDNLDVLKLLRETYLGKVKMIYIDPPYNTGNDFVYNDDFSQSADEYMETSGQYDEEGNRLVKNLESNGRFHTDWLNMIYPRLKVAKDLLSDDGVIFISIDDNEVENLKKVCNEVFGEKNFVGMWNWFKSATPPNLSYKIKKNIEYLIAYEKIRDNNRYAGLSKSSPSNDPFTKPQNSYKELRFPAGTITTILSDGVYKAGVYGTEKFPNELKNDLIVENGRNKNEVIFYNRFIWVQETLNDNLKNGLRVDLSKQLVLSYKRLNYHPECPPNLIDNSVFVDTTEQAGVELDRMFEGKHIFDYPKPVSLLKYILRFKDNKDSIVLDFFSGSATTAHAVMQLNAEDGGNRKFIMVQLPEECDEKSEAYKAGYKTICEIGEERIRRAGKKIREGLGDRGQGIGASGDSSSPLTPKTSHLDTGFRVLKLDSSNMQDVYYNPMAMRQSLLDETIDNVKTDRTPLDLLFQVMLDLGVELSAKIEEKQVNGKTYFVVNGNDLIACFDEDIDNDVITEIAKQQPLYAVFKSTSFATDSASINNEQLFKTYSPSTVIKVI